MKQTLFVALFAAAALSSCAQGGKKDIDPEQMVRDADAIVELQNQMGSIVKEARSAQQKYNGQVPDSVEARLMSEYQAIEAQHAEARLKFIKDYKGTEGGASMLLEVVRYAADGNEVKELMELYKDGTDCEALQKARTCYEGLCHRTAGAPVTNLVMATPEGETMNLTDVVGHGNYVLVDFWASWCGPCRAEMPNVKAAYEKYHPKGFEIVGVSFDSDKNAWTKAIETLELPWKHMSDLKGWQCAASEAYSVYSIPCTVLFDPEGKVIDANLRGEEIAERLEQLYK